MSRSIGLRFPRRGAKSHPRFPYQLLSLLLQYPDAELVEAEAELARAIESLDDAPWTAPIRRFWAHWASLPPIERAQRYVATFDHQKRTSLYLSYYLHGDRRQRGIALLRLKQLYAADGFVLTGGELPDNLPVMLEFAAFAPDEHGRIILSEYRPALEILRASLRDRHSPFADLVDALAQALPPLSSGGLELVERLITEGPPSEQVGLEPFAPPEVVPARGAHP